MILGASHKRVKRLRLGVFAQGAYPSDEREPKSGWSSQLMTDVWQEPIGMNLMLLPYCLTPEWLTTFTGNYARLSFSDFGLTEGTGGWRKGGLQGRIANDGDMSAAAITTATFGGDRGFYVSFFPFSAGNGERIELEVGYGSTGSATDVNCKLALQFWTGGRVYVNRNGELAGEGDVGSTPNEVQRILVLPMNVREVLVWSVNNGRGFIHVCDDVEESDSAPRVVPDTNFWFYRPEGAVDVEFAPLRFASTGTAYSIRGALPDVPGSTEVQESPEAFRRIEQGGGVSVVLTDLAGANYAYTAGQDVRLKVTLTGAGSGAYTPFVQGALAGFPAVTKPTDPNVLGQVELSDRAIDVTLSVPESPCDVSVSFQTIGREEGVDDLLHDLARLTNLPMDLKLGALEPFFRGQSGPTPETLAATDEGRGLSATFRDWCQLFEPPAYRDPYPFDGLTLTAALTRILNHAGYSSGDYDIESNTFVLPLTEGAALGEWSEFADTGDSCWDQIRRLLETYAATWIYGWFPTSTGVKFRAGSPETHFGATAKETLYLTAEESVTAGHVDDANDPDAAWRFVVHSFEETRLQTEANEVRYSGYDKKLRRPIQAKYTDLASIDPETAYTARPDNWEGQLLPLWVADHRVTTQDACERACGILAGRVTQRRVVCRFECELILDPTTGQPLWRGDVIEIAGKGTYRINTIEARWLVSEPDDAPSGFPMRRCRATYTATKGAGAALGNRSLTPTLMDVKESHEERLADRIRVRQGSEFLLKRPVGIQTTATLLTS
jgi:hypothetical protein